VTSALLRHAPKRDKWVAMHHGVESIAPAGATTIKGIRTHRAARGPPARDESRVAPHSTPPIHHRTGRFPPAYPRRAPPDSTYLGSIP
jgi:hypothetical protein